MGDMRALMASAALGVKRIEEIAGALRHRRAGRRPAPARGAHPHSGAHQARRDLRLRHPPLHRCDRFRRPRQRPVPSAPGADARAQARRRGSLHLRRHRDRRPVAGAGEPAAEPRRARARRSPCSIWAATRRRSATPAARRHWTRCGCAKARCCGRKFPAPLGMRGLTLMRFLAAVNGLVNVAGGKAPAAHSAYVISFLRGTFRNDKGELEPLPDVRRHRRRLGRAALRRRHRRRLFRRPGELPRRVPRDRLSRAAPRLRHPGRFLRRRPLSRRLRHRARVRHPGRGSRPRRPHRQRQEPAVGHRWRHGGRHRSRRGQSRHQSRARAGAACRTATC